MRERRGNPYSQKAPDQACGFGLPISFAYSGILAGL
jgi:hypothetical protein